MQISEILVDDVFSFRKGIKIENIPRLTAVIGKNNSGKSNVLKMIEWLKINREKFTNSQKIRLDDSITHLYPRRTTQDRRGSRSRFQLRLMPTASEVAALIQSGYQDPSGTKMPALEKFATDLFEKGILLEVDNKWTDPQQGDNLIRYGNGNPLKASFSLQGLADETVKIYGSKMADAVRALVTRWVDSIVYIKANRSPIEPRTNKEPMVKALHDWDGSSNHAEVERFEEIQTTFQLLTGLTGARIKSNGKVINIDYRDVQLPLDSLGDGIKHILILAFELKTNPNSTFLIEEIENHLHPEAQRTLMRDIKSDITSQFLITCHSPVIIDDLKDALVLRMDHDGNCSTPHPCNTMPDMYAAFDAIDARASDILQANVVIWVEGPSDRQFIKRCLELTDSALREGHHYQFAYYGGTIRKHFTVGDGSAHLVNVLRLGRHAVMIADSDKPNESAPIDPEKGRLAEEVTTHKGLSWITRGRTIENYLKPSVINRTLTQLLKDAGFVQTVDIKCAQYDDLHKAIRAAVEARRGNGEYRRYNKNKVEMMAEFAKQMTSDDLDILDLERQLVELKLLIRGYNGMSK